MGLHKHVALNLINIKHRNFQKIKSFRYILNQEKGWTSILNLLVTESAVQPCKIEGSITEVLPHLLLIIVVAVGVTFDLGHHVIKVAVEVVNGTTELFDPQTVEVGEIILCAFKKQDQLIDTCYIVL